MDQMDQMVQSDGFDFENQNNDDLNDDSGAIDTISSNVTETEHQTSYVSIDYNGRPVNLPVDALTALDSVLDGNIGLILERGLAAPQEPSQEALILDSYASAAGYDNRQEYIKAMAEQLNAFEVQNEVMRLQMQYPDTPAEALIDLAAKNVEINKQQQAQQQAAAQEQIRQAQLNAQNMAAAEKVRPFLEFYNQYPDIKKDSLTPHFFELVKNGLHPAAAYERLQNEQLKMQLSALAKNTQNANTAIGSMESSHVSADPFMSGFGF